MNKFNTLLVKVGKQYLLTEADLGAPQMEEGSAIPQAQQAAPAPAPAQEADKLTVEGKRYLIELALKALTVSPDQLSETDKPLLSTVVTAENADSIQKRIQGIIDQLSAVK